MHPADETGEPETTIEPAVTGEAEAAGSEKQSPAPFGSQEPTRFAADVAYRGRVGEHDYLVQVRHRFLDTSCTVEIDGVAHDPKAEEKARRKAGKKAEGRAPDTSAAADASAAADTSSAADTSAVGDASAVDGAAGDGDTSGDADAGTPLTDDLRFRLEEGFTVLHCTVRRPDEDGDHEDAEVITVRTAGLGGAGEVDVRQGLTRRPLAPDEDSPSAARDRRRTAHPTRYALLAALTRAAAFLIPLLGLGALFSGILEPLIAWVIDLLRPIGSAIMSVVTPVLEWVDDVLRPIREFLDELTRPVREFLDRLLQPVRDLLESLRELLRRLLDALALPVDVPGWVVDVAVPVIVVLVVFAVTFRGLRTRRRRLEAARASSTPRRAAGGESEHDGDGRTTVDAAASGPDAAASRPDAAASRPDAAAARAGDQDRRSGDQDRRAADRESPAEPGGSSPS